MDLNRQLRFLIPPAFLLLSLMWGLYLDRELLSKFREFWFPAKEGYPFEASMKIIGLITAGGVVLIATGMLISSVSLLFIRFFCYCFSCGSRHYEACIGDATFDRIWRRLMDRVPSRNRQRRKAQILYATITFDHEVLSEGIHDWLGRRWNMFNVCIHSVFALILAHVFGLFLSMKQWPLWSLSSLVVGIPILVNGLIAWRETINMIDFQSRRRREQPRRETEI